MVVVGGGVVASVVAVRIVSVVVGGLVAVVVGVWH